MTTAQGADAPLAVFVDAKGRRWAPRLTARAVWQYEAACGISLFQEVFNLVAEQPADDDAGQDKARADARLFGDVPEDMLRLALRLFGRPRNVALLIWEGCNGTPVPPGRDLILVDDTSGAFVRGVAAVTRWLRCLFVPSSRRRKVSLDDLGNAITSSRLMGEAILCAHQAVLDFFPDMRAGDAGQGTDKPNP